MADEQPQPPKKVSSLRDRIAAFEKQSTAQPSSQAPVPRVKPGGIAWKPKQPSPPSSPSARTDGERAPSSNIVPGSRMGGMSAADAKESIGQGGSLKERMAALQGKGAFGSPSPPAAPPKPAADKPKWKPPPSISPSPLVEKDQLEQDAESHPTEASQLSEVAESTDDAETKLEDPEEEDRLRRAAITARLQRLGGSKIGMGPPILGAKPAVKKSSLPKEEEPKVVDGGSDMPTQSTLNSQQEEGEARSSSEAVELDQESAITSSTYLSTAAISSDIPTEVKPPLMPALAVPRRVAPPRRKAGKPNPPVSVASQPTVDSDESPSDAPQAVSISEADTDHDKLLSSVITSTDEATVKLDVPVLEQEESSDADLVARSSLQPTYSEIKSPVEEPLLSGELASIPSNSTSGSIDSVSNKLPEPAESRDAVLSQPSQSSHLGYSREGAEFLPAVDMEDAAAEEKNIEELAGTEGPDEALQEDQIQEEEMESPSAERREPEAERDDDDNVDRRTRIAERLAKSGGVNPFAAGGFASSLRRKSSTSTTASRRDSTDHSDDRLSRDASIHSTPPFRNTSADVSSATTRVVETEDGEGEDTDGHMQQHPEQDTIRYPETSHQEQHEDDENEYKQSEENTLLTPRLLSEVRPVALIPETQSALDDIESENQDEQFSEDQDLTDPMHADGSEKLLSPSAQPVMRNALLLPPKPSRAIANELTDVDDGVATPSASVGYSPLSPPPPPPLAAGVANKPSAVLSSQSDILFVPPPPPLPSKPAGPKDFPETSSDSSYAEEDEDSFELPVHNSIGETSQQVFHPSQHEPEILDDSDCDPIDPGFLSPIISPKRDASHGPPRPAEEPSTPTSTQDAHPASVPDEAQEDQTRKLRLAERMAKLGGIRFGAPPLVNRPPMPREEVQEGQPSSLRPQESNEEREEDEQARRQRIAAKLAGMGGMRVGMLPFGMSSGPPPSVPSTQSHPPSEVESISEDEGVKVDAEESEMEEVNYEDAEEEIPSPITPYDAKPAISAIESVRKHLPLPGVRPPVPTSMSFTRKPSVRKSSTDSNQATQRNVPPQSEYVMVEEPVADISPPLPPPRSTRAPHPPRYAPPPVPTPPADAPDSLAFSQWELPSIPSASLDLGGTGDLSLSTWSEESTVYPSNTARSPSPPVVKNPRSTSQAEVVLSVDQLTSIWGRVGVQICEVAIELHDKSKKTLIGDGTYIGFLNAAMSRVPNALPFDPNSSSFGYLIYAQTGASVQKRLADIMPGDIVMLQDAKLKGHKGLQTYHQNVGEGEPLVGIIGEFDQKKSKVRVYQANRHVGHQTVESVSYRLEDLKSGSIKIFRALES